MEDILLQNADSIVASMQCSNCKKQIENGLHRVNEKGVKGIFWCQTCIAKYEPELFNNLKDEDQFKIMQIIAGGTK